MNRYEKVIEILNNSVGGPTEPVGFPHGPFWRGLSRDEFVAKSVVGIPLLIVGNGAESNLIKALKGFFPFGADLGVPDATFDRMPSGFDPVSDTDIAFIEKWINDGCPVDELTTTAKVFTWQKTGAPTAGSRTDDVWFNTDELGWAVNSDGKIIKTTDGGMTWTVQFTSPSLYLRCVGFANNDLGWVGTISRAQRLLQTKNGGTTWTPVTGLPTEAPVKVCGLSVVNDRVIYASGTNDPRDSPAMLKSTDGGATWTAWSMTAHASVLIDCYFVDELHGWVVGGIADEPPPTTRNRLKPVVLETSDGGVTWTNRFVSAGGDPSGEWGWKIQFLNANHGFVSLEKLDGAAILKTSDGGRTWTRLPVNDQQGNANLEGIGFIDANNGWVGGWGSADFSKGYSSATTDGGLTWRDANEIGRFINRFRFLGNPVRVGYASGDTVYKYSDKVITIAPSAAALTASASRAMLPDAFITGTVGYVQIPLDIPENAKRVTLFAWDRFGEELGPLLDEIHPQSGPRNFIWETVDQHGKRLTPGEYLLRLTVDDATAACTLKVLEKPTRADLFSTQSPQFRISRRSNPALLARPSRYSTIAQAVAAPVHDLAWLRDALQMAIQLEFATLPPYLMARWSIVNMNVPVGRTIRSIRGEEMLHMGIACNLLTGIGGTPLIAAKSVVPKYPGPLPCGIRPGLIVTLRKLDKAQAGVFMDIEHPQFTPLALVAVSAPTTIGEFYANILQAFQDLNPTFDTTKQLSDPSTGLTKIADLAEAEAALNLINLQGEGSEISPEESPGELSHYYQFGEIFHGKKLKLGPDGKYSFSGDDVPLPPVHNMADIPANGYLPADIPDPDIRASMEEFDRTYSEMLVQLERAWANGNSTDLSSAIMSMRRMGTIARDELIVKPLPDGSGNYGPCFRYV